MKTEVERTQGQVEAIFYIDGISIESTSTREVVVKFPYSQFDYPPERVEANAVFFVKAWNSYEEAIKKAEE